MPPTYGSRGFSNEEDTLLGKGVLYGVKTLLIEEALKKPREEAAKELLEIEKVKLSNQGEGWCWEGCQERRRGMVLMLC